MSTISPVRKRAVPFLALGGVWEQDDIDAASRVIAAAAGVNGNFFPLPEEAEFQAGLAAHEESRHAVAVNSCGTALDLCMIALDIKPGDEVIVPGLTFVCTAGTAAARGAKIVFADVDEKTLCLNPAAVEAKITPRTKAVIPVHFAGHSCDVEAFEALSRRHDVEIIYDAAHAVGTRHRGRGIGGFGRASCYSFQSNKNMTCLGEGGAVTSNDPEFSERVRGLKTFGYVYGAQFRVTQIGFNYRMTKPQCAVGLTQLAKIDRVIAARLKVFELMNRLLAEVDEIIRPAGIEAGHGCHLYVARIDTRKLNTMRESFLKLLKDQWSITCGHHYPAVWNWEAFARVDYDKSDTPVTHAAVDQVMSLPLFPATQEEDVEYIAHALKETVAAVRR